MPTGLKNSKPLQAFPRQSRQTTVETFQIVFAETGVPQTFPPLLIPPGIAPALRGVNGLAANAEVCFVAANPDLLLSPSQRRTITPDTEIQYPARRLSEIWVMGTKGDGVAATVSGIGIS